MLESGDIHFRRGEYDKAIADYTEAIRLNPKDAEERCNRGSVRYAKGEYDKAIADCTEAIRLDPRLAAASTVGASPTMPRVSTMRPSPTTRG